MVQQSDLDRLTSAWRALSGEGSGEGWKTIPVTSDDIISLLAARHFPGDEEAIFLGFRISPVLCDKNLPAGQGFLVERVTHKFLDDHRLWISLSRQPSGDLGMFTQMVGDVWSLLATPGHACDRSRFRAFIERVRAWQAFMHHTRDRLLGFESEVGLMGEIFVLNLLLDEGLSAKDALQSWRGPLGGKQDFLIGNGAIEVKSTVSTQDFPATISSLEQLDTSAICPIYLAGVRYVMDSSGSTLPAAIEGTAIRFAGEAQAEEKFGTLLLEAGFLRTLSDQYWRRFRFHELKIILVDSDFPALTRGRIGSPAIRKIRYELDLDQLPAPSNTMEATLNSLRELVQ